ncbi:DNA cytosine methyltransferase [Blautia producta]|uniref:DNA cytosine methyltransferase n=1 Tax=Blautia producta TaxID=33035 RepID=UPI001D077104|nr:DNA cytosine methyltransferase [Blautia producta]MCB6728166.1 DNA cytosine methyltransferase [Blautia marasmi]MCQ5097551.1 DNA cytosine methyltransferase [Blautia producta]
MKDLIIDCFAGGGGASVGIEMALGRTVDIAINHDEQAIRMHRTNHPGTLHLTEDIFRVDLEKYVKGQHVALMWASPDCTSHSKAKGGQPRKSGLRILPWAVYKHAKAILPDVIIMENVEEIQQWGPLDESGKPIPERKGEDYRRFISAMQSIGYVFDSRELVAADYGAPTTRKRWYAIFRRDGRPIIWPEPTHSKNGVGGKQKWVPVANVLDFSDLGQSIFTRKKPLAEKTMIRTANGIKKFVMDNPNPFFLSERQAYPFLIQYHSETCGGVRGQNITEPVMTLDTSNRYGLVSVFVEKFYKTGTGQDANEPLHTITTSPGHFGLVSVFLTKYYGSGCGQPANDPLGTITTKDRFGMTSVIISGEPMRIVDIRLRMLKPEELKLAQGFPADYIINRDYMWKTYPKSEQVKRIGNSVVPIMAEALVRANCGYLKVGERKPAPIIYQRQNGQVAFG